MRAITIAFAAAIGGAPLAMGACSFDAVGAGSPVVSDDAFAGDVSVDTGSRIDTGTKIPDAAADSGDSGDSAIALDAADASDASDAAKDTGAAIPDASALDSGHDSAVVDSGAHDAGPG